MRFVNSRAKITSSRSSPITRELCYRDLTRVRSTMRSWRTVRLESRYPSGKTPDETSRLVKAYAPCEVFESWIAMQRLELWRDLQLEHPSRTIVISLFKPFECVILVVQRRVDEG